MGVIDILVWVAIIGIFLYLFEQNIREHFNLSVRGYELLDVKIMKHLRVGGKEIASLTPFSCPPEKSDLDAGLCYQKCKTGYHGVGPVCWIDTFNRGIGTPVGLEPCPSGWNNDGLICREPVRWENRCVYWGLGNWSGCAKGGALRGRLNNGGMCPNTDPGGPAENTERVDGLCYKKCPPDKPEYIKGMPYLCAKMDRIDSYGRGVGTVPPVFRLLEKYTFIQL
jgi:hypothetical protein